MENKQKQLPLRQMKEAIRNINPLTLQDVSTLQSTLILLLNVVEEQSDQIDKLKQEVKELKDEINRLKKEQGVPVFPPKKDKSSEESDGSKGCLLYTSPSPRDRTRSRMPSSA